MARRGLRGHSSHGSWPHLVLGNGYDLVGGVGTVLVVRCIELEIYVCSPCRWCGVVRRRLCRGLILVVLGWGFKSTCLEPRCVIRTDVCAVAEADTVVTNFICLHRTTLALQFTLGTSISEAKWSWGTGVANLTIGSRSWVSLKAISMPRMTLLQVSSG